MTGFGYNINGFGVLGEGGLAPLGDWTGMKASRFNGSSSHPNGDTWLSRTSLTGVGDSNTFTVSFIIKKDGNGNCALLHIGESNSQKFTVFQGYGASFFFVEVHNTSDQSAIVVNIPLTQGDTAHYTISCDISDSAKRHVFKNGRAQEDISWATYITGTALDFTWDQYQIGAGDDGSTRYWWYGLIGEVYFHTTYHNLPVSNPFWDSGPNSPVVMADIITALGDPLIGMPIIYDSSGDNSGTGGDFTVNGTPANATPSPTDEF